MALCRLYDPLVERIKIENSPFFSKQRLIDNDISMISPL